MVHKKGNSKAKDTTNMQAVLPRVVPISDDTIQESISSSLLGKHASISVKEFGAMINRIERTVYNYTEPHGTNMSLAHFATLVRECARRGDFQLLDFMIPEEFMLTPIDHSEVNGSLDDEIGDATEALGEARGAFNSRQIPKAKLAANNAKKALARLEQEIRLREGR